MQCKPRVICGQFYIRRTIKGVLLHISQCEYYGYIIIRRVNYEIGPLELLNLVCSTGLHTRTAVARNYL